jgi:hypothetical protein
MAGNEINCAYPSLYPTNYKYSLWEDAAKVLYLIPVIALWKSRRLLFCARLRALLVVKRDSFPSVFWEIGCGYKYGFRNN